MKKILSIILAVAVVLSFAVFALGSGESGTESQGSGQAEGQSASETTLGDYEVEIKSCRLAKDYEDKDIIIVTYGFTNNSDNPTAFTWTFSDEVYQSGIGLNKSYIVADSAKYSSDNQSKEIKKGATLDVEVAYELNDTTTDVEVEVSELISFSDKTITKTFSIK